MSADPQLRQRNVAEAEARSFPLTPEVSGDHHPDASGTTQLYGPDPSSWTPGNPDWAVLPQLNAWLTAPCSGAGGLSLERLVVMSSRDLGQALRGRRDEREVLDRLVAHAREGQSQVLLLRGAAGVGKTTLLDYLRDQASGYRVAPVSGVQSEMEMAYAGLHQLCGPFLDRLEQLPAPQRVALGIALGSATGETPDRFLVGLAVLTLLSQVAEERPLLCIVDDAQWLDQASAAALSFVARRLGAEPVGLVFAVRDPVDDDDDEVRLTEGAKALLGLPDLEIGGLAEPDAKALLESVVSGPLDDTVRDRIVAETGGNPLALLELPRGMTQAQLSFGVTAVGPGGAPAPQGVTGRLQEGFRRRLDTLPDATRLLLLIAAAEPTGDVRLLWRAATGLGIAVDAVTPAQEAALLELGTQVKFRHPLVRSTVYRAASAHDRRRAHAALADATDPTTGPDRRAWHRAQSTVGLDEAVAAELETSAARAKARGGLAASAAFLARAIELTPDPSRRAERALAAASVKLESGAPEAALVLLAIAEAGPLTDLDRARAQLLRAQVSFAVTRGREAASLLLAAAKRLEPLDATLARETYLDAFTAALFADRLAAGAGVEEVARAVLNAHWGTSSRDLPRACELLLSGLALLLTEGHHVGVPPLRQALNALRFEPVSDEDALRWLWLASRVARALGDDVAWDELTDRHVRLAHATGALSVLPIALTERFSVHVFAGNLSAALALVAEADGVLQVTGGELSPHIAFLLAAWLGHETEALALIEASRQDVDRRGEGLFLIGTDWTTAVYYNSLGRYRDALTSAERAAEHPYALGLSTWVYPELVEAAVRSGRPERGTAALEKLAEIAQASGTDWALGVEARSRALLSEGQTADALYQEAIERLRRTSVLVARARAHLVYGEWLRRERRRTGARDQLRTAHGLFLDLGMSGFAERARRELTATGETARTRTVDTLSDLTMQEAQIARLAVSGLSNPEIAAQLFLSPRTVEWHMRKVFGKLGINNRKELRAALPAPRTVSVAQAR